VAPNSGQLWPSISPQLLAVTELDAHTLTITCDPVAHVIKPSAPQGGNVRAPVRSSQQPPMARAHDASGQSSSNLTYPLGQSHEPATHSLFTLMAYAFGSAHDKTHTD
jgi:hypothetical protein